jgi:polysaccharide deacetylase family protein (PEP-CTERM system associated)
LVYNQDPAAFRADVRRTRGLLEDLTGCGVYGYRAPSYTIVESTQWALSILADEGYLYDSSIFPIHRRRYGMPRAPRWPWRMSLPDGRGLAEFPLPTIRCGLFNLPASGGAYLRLLPFALQRWALGRMRDSRRPFVLTIHPWELDPEQPRFPVGLRTRWTHYHNLDRTTPRLETLLSTDAYRPLIEVLQELDLLEDRPARD